MLKLYSKKIGETWYATVLNNGKIMTTNFAGNKEKALKPLLKSLPYNVPFEEADKPNPTAEEVFRAMNAILEGKNVSFKFEFDMDRLPRTTRRVLELMALIPMGYATTYGSLAKVVGTGPRVAGHACAANPFAPIVPCHRVVAYDLSLGGYGGGLKLKWKILKREDRGFKEVSNVKLGGKTLPLFPICQLKPPAER